MNAPTRLPELVAVSTAAVPHESAQAHVSGAAQYVDDIPELRGTLYAAPVTSKVAHGRLNGIDATRALALPGVRGIVTASDIPGDRIIATHAHDEPVLAFDTVEHVGQVVALIIADDTRIARKAAAMVILDITPLPAILTIEESIAQQSWVLPPVTVTRGDPLKAIARAAHQLSGEYACGGQEHFYLEGQVAYCLPQEQDGWLIYLSTQYPAEAQHWVAHAMGIDSNAVRIECRRMGGGFGGKESQAQHLAIWTTLAARKFASPVKLRYDRDDDMSITGKRHNFLYRYTVGFDDEGRLLGMKLMLAGQCGFSADLSGPVCDRAIFHADNAYFLEHVEIESLRCKTNTQSNTAFRGFGGPQGMVVIERIVEDIARTLGRDPLDVRRINFYGTTDRNVTPYGMTIEDNIIHPIVDRLEASSDYRARRAAIEAFNGQSPIIKRGISLTPVKFGISFTATFFNQAGALVNVYADGSVQVNHGGTEMGQGLHTKVCQVVAKTLGIPLSLVRITASATDKVPNASPTAASSGTDLNGRAAENAAREIRGRLTEFMSRLDGCDAKDVSFDDGMVTTPLKTREFADVVSRAYFDRVQLWSDGFYATPKIHYDKFTLTGRPFYYFAYGAACTEVAIDTLTGESRVIGVDVLHDVGRSINPAIDLGQIEGGFVQGMGWLTTEELVWNPAGKLTTHAPSTYKIPAVGDLPARWNIGMWEEDNIEDTVFRSKAVGEPPFMLAISVFEAMRDAVASVAAPGQLVEMNAPATPPEILRALNKVRQGQPTAVE